MGVSRVLIHKSKLEPTESLEFVLNESNDQLLAGVHFLSYSF